MYYISSDISALQEYNTYVGQLIGLIDPPYKWAEIITHKNGGLYAIQKHEVYTSNDFEELEELVGWFDV